MVEGADSFLGKQLPGGYKIERYVAAGGFAWVFEGRTSADERCAVKIPFHQGRDANKRFVREIKVLRELPASPHRVRYLGDGVTEEGLPFLATEFIEGNTFKEVLQMMSQWPPIEACAFMSQLCAALADLHQLGLANRDVKPENIMITYDRQVKLLDFGLVKDAQGLLKLFEAEDILDGADFAENIDRGMLAGTPEYMAPEQFTDSSLENPDLAQTDTWTDVYSLGLIFYEMLTGQKLFPFRLTTNDAGQRARELVTYMQLRVQQGNPLPSCPDGIDPAVWFIVGRALRHDPRRRYRDATELWQDIEVYRRTGSVSAIDDETTVSGGLSRIVIGTLGSPPRVETAQKANPLSDTVPPEEDRTEVRRPAPLANVPSVTPTADIKSWHFVALLLVAAVSGVVAAWWVWH